MKAQPHHGSVPESARKQGLELMRLFLFDGRDKNGVAAGDNCPETSADTTCMSSTTHTEYIFIMGFPSLWVGSNAHHNTLLSLLGWLKRQAGQAEQTLYFSVSTHQLLLSSQNPNYLSIYPSIYLW